MSSEKKPRNFYGELDEDPDHKNDDDNGKSEPSCLLYAKVFGLCFVVFMLFIAIIGLFYLAASDTH